MSLLTSVVGDIRWTRPAWLQRLGTTRFVLLLLVLAGLTAAAYLLKQRWDNRIQPPQVVVDVEAPDLTPIINDEPQPTPLFLRFRVESDPRLPSETSNSVAAIEQVGEVVSEGIALEPALEGEWRWQNEHTLTFVPAIDWPAGETYEVTYQTSLFRAGLAFERLKASFTTPGLSVTIPRWAFYQNPADSGDRRVVGTLEFSHAVDLDSVEQQLQLGMRPSGLALTAPATDIDFTLATENADRRVFVTTELIDLPAEENFLSLTLAKGVKAANGPARTPDAMIEHATVPDVGSYFRVADSRAVIARDSDDNPIQNLTIAFTDRVESDRLADHLEVYLLPREHTVNGNTRRNITWQSPREVTAAVLQNADRIDVSLSPVKDDTALLHSIQLDLPPRRQLYLRVREGLISSGEFVLANTFDTLVRVPDYPREVRVAQEGALLPLSGDQRLTLIGRGLSTIRVEVGRVPVDELNHLATQTGGDIGSPYFSNYAMNENNLTERQTRYLDLEAAHPSQPVYTSIDMSQFARGSGAYFVTVQGWNRSTQRTVGSPDKRFVLTTDSGLIVKSNADNSHDVFVHSLTGTGPIAGAEVSLLGKNGVPVFRRFTNGAGRASIPVTSDLRREKTPAVFVVRNGNDVVFLPFNRSERRLQFSRFDVGGEYTNANDASRVRAQLFSDRGLYRPGENIRLGAIVKRSDWGPLPQLPLRLQVTDSRGQLFVDRTLALPADGLLEATVATENVSPTGNYRATLLLVERNNRRRVLGSTAVRVEEFQPDRMRIRTEVSGQQAAGWLQPDDLSAEVTLTNLFGAPAQQRTVRGELIVTPTTLRVSEYPDYEFTDPLRDPDAPFAVNREPLPETMTNDQGIATFALALERFGRGIYQLEVATEGFEASGGRSVKSRARVMVSPLDVLVGYKTTSDLSYLTRNSDHAVDFVAIDPRTEQRPLDGLTATISELEFVSSLIRRPDGTYAYESVQQRNEISSTPYSISATGTRFDLPTTEAGTFELALRDSRDRVVSRVEWHVAGARNLAGNLERNAELTLALRETSVSAGAELELEITAPYAGTGLITIERERTYSHHWFTTTTNTTVQRVRVPASLEGNAYVNVAFVRSLGSAEIFVSPLSYAVAPFSIDRDARTVEMTLDAAAIVKPGEQLQVTHSATENARAIIYAVDTGILQVANYDAPDPLAFFFRKLALNVRTLQMVDLILPDFSAWAAQAAPGGGEAGALLGRNLNPFRRTADAPMVYWSGVIETGPDARTLDIPIPDHFAGELRIMAVTVTDSAVGQASTRAIAKGPFVLTPNLLTAVAPGDEFDVVVGVANQLEGRDATSTISLQAASSTHLEIIGDTQQALSVAPGSETSVTYRVRALPRFGDAELRFTATAGDDVQVRAATTSVRPAQPYVTTIETVIGSDDPLAVTLPRTLATEYAEQKVAASASPLVLTDGLVSYLEGFPHACTEQIVSKTFPQLGLLGVGDSALNEVAIRDQFSTTLSRLRSRQLSSGGFRFWASSSEPQAFASVYLLHFLSDAKDQSMAVPDAMLRSGLDYLGQLANQTDNSWADARVRAYAIYVLTRNGTVTTNSLTQLHEALERDFPDRWHEDIVATWMAASYQMLQQDELAAELIDGYAWQTDHGSATDFDSRLTRDAQYLYLLARHFPDRATRLSAEPIRSLAAAVMENRFNTVSAAFTTLALGALSRANGLDGSPARLAIAAGDTQISAVALFARGEIPVANRDVTVTGGGGQRIYTSASQQGYDETPPTTALAQGLEIDREFLNSDGSKVASARVGDTLTVRLRIRALERARSNVAIVDLLPGGFEVDTDSVSGGGRWGADHIEVREDRVVVYGTFGTAMTEISYTVKLTSTGNFTVPSAYANSMYDLRVQARTAPSRFEVEQ